MRVQLIRHFKTCTTDSYLQNECAHVGLSVHAPVRRVLFSRERARASERMSKWAEVQEGALKERDVLRLMASGDEKGDVGEVKNGI